eukprot:1136967-Ditylum_brightwellii.AAC.1
MEEVKEAVTSLLLYAITVDTSSQTRDAVTNNANAQVTSLEEYVGADCEETVGDRHPASSVAIKEMIARIKEQEEYLNFTKRNF